MKYAEQKIFCICLETYKIYEGNDFDKIYEVLSTIENKQVKTNNISIEKYKEMSENPDIEQEHWSRTAEGIYKTRHDSIRLMKCIC